LLANRLESIDFSSVYVGKPNLFSSIRCVVFIFISNSFSRKVTFNSLLIQPAFKQIGK